MNFYKKNMHECLLHPCQRTQLLTLVCAGLIEVHKLDCLNQFLSSKHKIVMRFCWSNTSILCCIKTMRFYVDEKLLGKV